MDSYRYRPITFENITFHPSVMGIDVLEYALPLSKDTADWIWRFPICCGVTKRSPSVVCHAASAEILKLIPKHRRRVDAVISERIDSELTNDQILSYWLGALEEIWRISRDFEGSCVWAAPSHAEDRMQTQEDHVKFSKALDNLLGD